MPDHQHGVGVRRLFSEPAQDLSILCVVELLHRVDNRQPDQLVDFFAGGEFTAGAARRPVVHLLDAQIDRVTHRVEPPAEDTALTGLLEYFPHGSHRRGLPGVHFALG